MIDWIRGKFSTVLDWIRHGAEVVSEIFQAVWLTIQNLGTLVTDAWSYMLHGVEAIVNWGENLAIESFKTMWWIVTKRIPEWFNHAVHAAENIIGHAIELVKGWVHEFVNAVKAGIVAIINTVKSWASDLFDWAKARISDLWNLANHTADLVFKYLGDLDHLAIALVGKLIQPLFDYIIDHGRAWADWLLRHMVHSMLAAADFIEGVIADVL